ncbi:MAG: DUF1343 domain-containing protein [Lentimicrobium sp.]|nr:DUF1343 domain-containing protein [Lentimicrobium sp.]
MSKENNFYNTISALFILLLLTLQSCGNPIITRENNPDTNQVVLKTGAERTELYFESRLKGKSIAIVANQTSLVAAKHLVDTLFSAGFDIQKVFAPEHGFRGEAEAGAVIINGTDTKTGLPVISLYGKKKKPDVNDLQGIDLVIFDIQDVGARFYTYISTLSYIMEACAEQGIELLVLDRPNPHGFYVDGPVLEPANSSFVGMHKIPVVHGMTIAEYARMVNGEGWLKNGIQCELGWIEVEGYTHNSRYNLPVRPSPNLPDMESIYLYPSLCLFEGTVVSVGRGTQSPFRIIGHPSYKSGDIRFTPQTIKGVSENPPYKGIECRGLDLIAFAKDIEVNGNLRLNWLIEMYEALGSENKFFDSFFEKLVGTSKLKEQILAGKTESQIRASWSEDLRIFKAIRKKYLLYPDFE